ncbi:group II intron maturase-specific domain-containing protein [Mesorhizobium sp. M1399]|uniref:group II intron maturase-specific domain-containing protein n=1 Tax=Mesorhizobium sp. M1399 TaxID=2957096 RepID=UPI0033382A8F
MTRRTRGVSLPQLVKELKPYLVGWRGYLFCQTPRALTHLEAWIRRRLRMYLWRQWGTGTTASRNCAVRAYQSSELRLPPVHGGGILAHVRTPGGPNRGMQSSAAACGALPERSRHCAFNWVIRAGNRAIT